MKSIFNYKSKNLMPIISIIIISIILITYIIIFFNNKEMLTISDVYNLQSQSKVLYKYTKLNGVFKKISR